MDTTEERLVRLEKSLRRWRLAGLTPLGVVLVCCLAAAGRGGDEPKSIRASVVEIVNDKGIVVARLKAGEEGGVLELLNSESGPALTASVSLKTVKNERMTKPARFGGARVSWFDERGREVMRAGIESSEAELSMYEASSGACKLALLLNSWTCGLSALGADGQIVEYTGSGQGQKIGHLGGRGK